MLKRVPLSFDPVKGWYVDLPSYMIVPGSFLPITAAVIHADGVFPTAITAAVLALNPTVQVILPDFTPLDGAGQIIPSMMQKIYANHPRFGDKTYNPPQLA